MNYCTACGGPLVRIVPKGDNVNRHVCRGCGEIHYLNPKMVVGTVPVYGDKLLLCRRAIEPARGKWTLPAGYLENGETTAECAVRETREEAGAELTNLRPYTLINLPFINQIYFMYLADMAGNNFKPGQESLDVRLFSASNIPWSQIAFSSISEVLKLYSTDQDGGHFPFRVIDLHAENSS